MAGLRGKALIAYLLVCTVWGSTYLFIRIGVAHLPPFLFAGVRFLDGRAAARRHRPGAWESGSPRARRTGAPSPSPGCSCSAAPTRSWSGRSSSSPPASRACSWPRCRSGRRSSTRSCPGARRRSPGGSAWGSPSASWAARCSRGSRRDELATADLRGPIALTFGSACWAMGSVYWKRNPTEVSPYVGGRRADGHRGRDPLRRRARPRRGARLSPPRDRARRAWPISSSSDRWWGTPPSATRSSTRSATVVGTYAYVNPVVAVLLGWLVLHEPITGRMLAAMALILGAVVWIQLAARPARARCRPSPFARSGAGTRRTHEPGRARARPRPPSARTRRRRGRAAGRGLHGRHAAARRVDPPGAPDGGALVRHAPCAGRSARPDPRRHPAAQRGARRAHHADARVSRDDHAVLHACGRRTSWSRRAAAGDWAERANRLVARYGHRELPLRHYTEARLKSPEARAGWVEPDLLPLP